MIENKNNNDYELENSTNKLKELSSTSSNCTKNGLNYKLHNKNNTQQTKKIGKRKDKSISILSILSIIIFLEGFLLLGTGITEEDLIIYFMGCFFFMACYHCGMYLKYFGLIFLFISVGGITMMIDACIQNVINSPIMTDISTGHKVYLYAALSLFIIATIYSVVYNLSDRVKDIKYSNYIPLLIYIVAFGMTIGFNYLVK